MSMPICPDCNVLVEYECDCCPECGAPPALQPQEKCHTCNDQQDEPDNADTLGLDKPILR